MAYVNKIKIYLDKNGNRKYSFSLKQSLDQTAFEVLLHKIEKFSNETTKIGTYTFDFDDNLNIRIFSFDSAIEGENCGK